MEKSCTKCGEVKPLEKFKVDSRTKSGRASQCKECHNAYYRKNYVENPDKEIARKKKHYEDNRDRYLALKKKHYAENRDEIAARKKKYREDYPEKNAAKAAKYNAAKLRRIPSWSNEADLKAIKKIYARCRRINKLTGVEHQVDHVIPLQGKNISGLHHSTNLAIIPAALNGSKYNKWEFQEVHYG